MLQLSCNPFLILFLDKSNKPGVRYGISLAVLRLIIDIRLHLLVKDIRIGTLDEMKLACFMAGLYTFVEQADALDNAARGDADIAVAPLMGELPAYRVHQNFPPGGQFHPGAGGEADAVAVLMGFQQIRAVTKQNLAQGRKPAL